MTPQTRPSELEAFEARIAAGQRIEPRDEMPEAYRRNLVRQMAAHAHSEYVGMLPEGAWLTRAPSLHRKAILLAKVQDEAGHAQYVYGALESLGVRRDEALDGLLKGESRFISIFNHPVLTWADVGMIGWLTDGAAIVIQVPLSRCSYGPYARAMMRVCEEESFHHRQGFDLVRRLVEGTAAQKQMAQQALDRWWWPTLTMFGPPDAESVHTDQSMRWGIKQHSNDTLRRRYLNQVVPQVQYLGLSVPDPDLHYDEGAQQWVSGAIDWQAVQQVMSGTGLCTADRLRVRQQAWDDGAWVREAALGYAASLPSAPLPAAPLPPPRPSHSGKAATVHREEGVASYG